MNSLDDTTYRTTPPYWLNSPAVTLWLVSSVRELLDRTWHGVHDLSFKPDYGDCRQWMI